ncbi:MAG: DUF1064 domain-containing protein [Candidatus Polarisedimenticolia bacterium]
MIRRRGGATITARELRALTRKRGPWQTARPESYAGITWKSGAEAKRARVLELERRAGRIRSWLPAPSFELVVNGERIGRYTPDFLVTRRDGSEELLEVKGGNAVREFGFRVRLFLALFPYWRGRFRVIDEHGRPWRRRRARRELPAKLRRRLAP